MVRAVQLPLLCFGTQSQLDVAYAALCLEVPSQLMQQVLRQGLFCFVITRVALLKPPFVP
jgi:hypothetical protein